MALLHRTGPMPAGGRANLRRDGEIMGVKRMSALGLACAAVQSRHATITCTARVVSADEQFSMFGKKGRDCVPIRPQIGVEIEVDGTVHIQTSHPPSINTIDPGEDSRQEDATGGLSFDSEHPRVYPRSDVKNGIEGNIVGQSGDPAAGSNLPFFQGSRHAYFS